ncbi:CGCGG family putative rSAM-modified RiPP protein [Bacillus sp. Marseille-P3661]|uniref:CGCGG family putative rSAM-modified RiPP protein n=1 Tax=Bacillus sp. Marseille-P3661 TaxID=1936234 RepID=UPI000C83876F|nr:CGCGG family rSAM-modified RiPP protein [Bacillus sp. Marseille-P3661]
MSKNWSVSLEHEEYENDLKLVIKDAIEAVEETEKGFYVNVVTPATFGNPADYLTDALAAIFNDKIKMKFIDQCGCGGYVLRVWKNNWKI